jgi:hypothetical protein
MGSKNSNIGMRITIDLIKLKINLFLIFKIDDGWWRGFCRGKVGLFPANYVELRN